MTDTNYNLVVQQESRNVVVQTPGPKGLQGNAGTGMSSITVASDSGNTGAIAGNASVTIAGDGNRIATSASGSTITITDSGIRDLTFTTDSGNTTTQTGASSVNLAGGVGVTTAATGSKVTISHEVPTADPTGTYAYVTSFTVDRQGHVSAVNKVDTADGLYNNIGANNASNMDAGSIGDARVPASAVTQHQSAINIAGSQVTSGTVPAARLDNIATSKVTSGTFADARIAASNVTQHASGISIGNLGNVSSSSPSDGSFLKYVNSSSEWQPAAFSIDLDASPQLGGNLDVNGNDIVSVSNGNIDITPNGSGKVVLDSYVEVTDGLISVKNSGAQSQVRFYDENSNSNYVGLKAPANAILTSDVTFVLPATDGVSNQVIQTDGSGNLSFATMTGDKAFKLDPTNLGITRLFDDFLGGSAGVPRFRFLSTSSVTGGTFNNAFHQDTLGATGTDLFGLAEAETSTSTAARVVMNCNRLMSNSPADGDEWLWEVRVKPQLATGDGYFMIAAIQPNGVGSIDHNDQLGVTAADDVPRALIYADKDNTYWKSILSNSTASVTPTAADTAAAYNDNTFVRLAVHCKYDSANTEYDIAIYVDGTSRFTGSLDAGQGSPYGRIELCNNGTGTAQRALFDWTMVQYTRGSVTYLDIESI